MKKETINPTTTIHRRSHSYDAAMGSIRSRSDVGIFQMVKNVSRSPQNKDWQETNIDILLKILLIDRTAAMAAMAAIKIWFFLYNKKTRQYSNFNTNFNSNFNSNSDTYFERKKITAVIVFWHARTPKRFRVLRKHFFNYTAAAVSIQKYDCIFLSEQLFRCLAGTHSFHSWRKWVFFSFNEVPVLVGFRLGIPLKIVKRPRVFGTRWFTARFARWST